MRNLAFAALAFAVFIAGCMEAGTEQPATQTTQAVVAPPSDTSSTGTTLKAQTTTTTIVYDESMRPTDTLPKLPGNLTGCLALDNESLRDLCLYDVGNKLKDMGVCDRIAGKNTMLRCKARLVEDSDLCDGVDVVGERDYCFRTMAFKWNDIRHCRSIFNQPIKDKCILDFVEDKKPDPMSCFDIANQDMKDRCILFHIGLYKQTGTGMKPGMCSLIANQSMQFACNQTYLHV